MSTIRHLKLVSGEEIIGKEVDSIITDKIRLESVRVLVMQPVGQGQMGVALIPWLVGDPDGKVDVPTIHVVGDPVNAPPKSIEDAYLQQTSGLTFAANSPSIQV